MGIHLNIVFTLLRFTDSKCALSKHCKVFGDDSKKLVLRGNAVVRTVLVPLVFDLG